MSDAKPLAGKTGVVFGVANKRSIAWAIARTLDRDLEAAGIAKHIDNYRLWRPAPPNTTVIIACCDPRDQKMERPSMCAYGGAAKLGNTKTGDLTVECFCKVVKSMVADSRRISADSSGG